MTDSMNAAWVRAVFVLACLLLATSGVASEPAQTLDFVVVEQAVDAYFESLDDYKAGDLIWRSRIQGALTHMNEAGWQAPDADAIVQLGLADNSRLVKQLSTPAGKKFMRKISGQPGGYARLDRLNSISRGTSLVNDLIRRKGGDELLIYMASTKGGRRLGRQLAATPRGVDINKPTGRIYTAEDLVAELKRVYEKRSP
jgi:hypothetical protein